MAEELRRGLSVTSGSPDRFAQDDETARRYARRRRLVALDRRSRQSAKPLVQRRQELLLERHDRVPTLAREGQLFLGEVGKVYDLFRSRPLRLLYRGWRPCSTSTASPPTAVPRSRRTMAGTAPSARSWLGPSPSPAPSSRLGEPKRAEIQKLYHAPDLTILNVVWAPRMTLMPHNHRMWAVIGIYTGREDNIFWRRVARAAGSRPRAPRRCREGDAVPLGRDIIHSVTNPIPRLTGAIHVYGGDFFAHRAQRVGPRDAPGAALRRGEDHAPVRGGERGLPGNLTLAPFACPCC